MLTHDQLDAAKLQLAEWGLCLVGVSSKSASTYWALTEDDRAKRLRLSNHAVAHACSDCAVCVGDSMDDDYGIDQLAAAVGSTSGATAQPSTTPAVFCDPLLLWFGWGLFCLAVNSQNVEDV